MIAAIAIASLPHYAPAATCAPLSAEDLSHSGDVAATGTIQTILPVGFVLAVDRVYTGGLPGHVLVLGDYDAGSPGTRHFVVMRSRLPGVFTMGACDGRPMSVMSSLGALGAGQPPAADLPVAQAAAIAGVLLALVLIRRRRGSGPPPAATATAY